MTQFCATVALLLVLTACGATTSDDNWNKINYSGAAQYRADTMPID